jgi:3-isopropylmalate/(R)-2-methylmalate dehydratase small subunit
MPIQSARLKPGVSRGSVAAGTSAIAGAASTDVIRGKALIFWDLKVLGKKKKLDAIDTDQITPAADCVSESLDTLDERWKAGAFRYLMPDFRARVHRGETFLIAGDRFAIGSSREMSPAGLKAIAEEVGRDMVIVCGHNMGDIFRRNALNLGLQVVQSPDAVADAKDGDDFSFEPESRRLTNETQHKTYDPVPVTP